MADQVTPTAAPTPSTTSSSSAPSSAPAGPSVESSTAAGQAAPPAAEPENAPTTIAEGFKQYFAKQQQQPADERDEAATPEAKTSGSDEQAPEPSTRTHLHTFTSKYKKSMMKRISLERFGCVV